MAWESKEGRSDRGGGVNGIHRGWEGIENWNFTRFQVQNLTKRNLREPLECIGVPKLSQWVYNNWRWNRDRVGKRTRGSRIWVDRWIVKINLQIIRKVCIISIWSLEIHHWRHYTTGVGGVLTPSRDGRVSFQGEILNGSPWTERILLSEWTPWRRGYAPTTLSFFRVGVMESNSVETSQQRRGTA